MQIKLDNVTIELQGKKVLNQITSELGQKELVVLLGLNGAGKTTLLKTIAGLIFPVQGRIYLNGQEHKKMSHRQKAKLISYIPQIAENTVPYSVFDFVLMGVASQKGLLELPGKKDRLRAMDSLEQAGIFHLKDKRMDQISGGERQLAYFARSILQDAEFMIMDEPMASLDFKRQYEFLMKLKEYVWKKGKGILISVHDPNLALRFADRIILIHEKKIENPILRKEPDFAQNYLKALNQIYGNRLKLVQAEQNYWIDWKEEDYCLQRKNM